MRLLFFIIQKNSRTFSSAAENHCAFSIGCSQTMTEHSWAHLGDMELLSDMGPVFGSRIPQQPCWNFLKWHSYFAHFHPNFLPCLLHSGSGLITVWQLSHPLAAPSQVFSLIDFLHVWSHFSIHFSQDSNEHKDKILEGCKQITTSQICVGIDTVAKNQCHLFLFIFFYLHFLKCI